MSAEKGDLKSLRADVCKVKTQGASGARGHVCMNLCIVYFGAPSTPAPGDICPPCPPPPHSATDCAVHNLRGDDDITIKA